MRTAPSLIRDSTLLTLSALLGWGVMIVMLQFTVVSCLSGPRISGRLKLDIMTFPLNPWASVVFSRVTPPFLSL